MTKLTNARRFFNERITKIRMKRSFAAVLDASIGAAVKWNSLTEVKGTARTQATLILNCQTGVFPGKGAPDLYAIRRRQTETLLKHLDGNEPELQMGTLLELAEKVASIDPGNVAAFRLYLSIFWIANYNTIQSLRRVRSPYVALHMTCRPRLERAGKSIESFYPIPSSLLMHLKLVGGGETYTFDAATGILGVPSGDSYEDLPVKLFWALFILVIACNPDCILKLDDDNRLADSAALIRLLAAAKDCRRAAQYGNLFRPSIPSAHHRGWHLGKCTDETLSNSLFEMPIPHAWALGGRGYILNRQALWRVAWSAVFYRRWLDKILYEDVAVGEVADKTWIDKIDCRLIDMAISRVDSY